MTDGGSQGPPARLRVILVTQDSPFYLAETVDRFLRAVSPHAEVCAAVVLDVSPFGPRSSVRQQAIDTVKVFGVRFFLRYSLRYLKVKVTRKPDVRAVFRSHRVPVIELTHRLNHPETLETFAALEPDLIISLAASQIFKKPLLDLPRLGCLNVHTALLPKYRGLMPTFWVLKNGETRTGVSVFLMDEGIDSGPIVVQREVEIGDRSQEQLIEVTKAMGADALAEAVSLMASGSIRLQENDDREMTYFSKPTRADVRAFYRAGKRFF